MRYDAVLAARAAAWLARDGQSTAPTGKRSAEGLLELATVWAAIQQVPLPACLRQCQYSERARDVAAYVREFHRFSSPLMSDPTAPSKYQLAPAFAGHSFVHEDYGKVVTADNYTDEDAAFFRSKGRTDAFVERTASPAGAEPATAAPAKPDDPARLTAEKEAHGKTKDALKAEKEAHKETKKELHEAQKHLATAQKQLDQVANQAADAADQAGDDQAR